MKEKNHKILQKNQKKKKTADFRGFGGVILGCVFGLIWDWGLCVFVFFFGGFGFVGYHTAIMRDFLSLRAKRGEAEVSLVMTEALSY